MRKLALLTALVSSSLSWTACSADPSASSSASSSGSSVGEVAILNVSFDATRELYDDVNAAFSKKWRADTGQSVTVRQSHGGSGKQARAVLDGLEADVVTLALSGDVDVLARAGVVGADWQKRLPNAASAFSSTIVFVVRTGNPKGIRGWDDLVTPGVAVITPNPKTSGAARLAYLAAWDHARRAQTTATTTTTTDAEKDAAATAFVDKLYENVPVLDTGARAATTTFAERGLGDVLLSWESDALFLLAKHATGFEVVTPSASIEAALPVAVVDTVVDRRGTRAVAEAYVQFLASDEGQEIAARHHYRARAPAVVARHPLPALALRSVADIAGSWSDAQQRHFDDGGIFDVVTTSDRAP